MIFFAAWMCKCRRVILMASLAIAAPTLASAEIVKVPMTAERWQPKNATTTVEFIAREGFPQGLMGKERSSRTQGSRLWRWNN
jgi:hypothetical protein